MAIKARAVGESANRNFWWVTLVAVSTSKQVETEKTRYYMIAYVCIVCMSISWDFSHPQVDKKAAHWIVRRRCKYA
jgi:hypothetical protein